MTFVLVVFIITFSLLLNFGVNSIMECIPANPILEFNPNSLEDIRKCWNLDNGRVKQSVDLLEDWLSKQNHIVNKKLSRRYLEATLMQCKGSVEKTKSQIDKLCTLKTLNPKFFIGGNVRQQFKETAEIAFITPLPKTTQDHCRPVFCKINPKEFTSAQFMNFYQQTIVICEYLKMHDYVNGFIVIEDFRDVSLMDLMTKINIVEFQQFLAILIEGFGARIKGVHILHKSKYIDLFMKTFKPLLPAKLANRLYTYHNVEELHNIVDKKLLPVEYGGEQKSIQELKDDWMNILSSEETEKFLAEAKASCTDESLRASGKFNENIMGLPGSFRTLSVD